MRECSDEVRLGMSRPDSSRVGGRSIDLFWFPVKEDPRSEGMVERSFATGDPSKIRSR